MVVDRSQGNLGYDYHFSPPEHAHTSYSLRLSRSLLSNETNEGQSSYLSQDVAKGDSAKNRECSEFLREIQRQVSRQQTYEKQLTHQTRLVEGAARALKAKEAERDELIRRITYLRKKYPTISPPDIRINPPAPKNCRVCKFFERYPGPGPQAGAEYQGEKNENQRALETLEMQLGIVEIEIKHLRAEYEEQKKFEDTAKREIETGAALEALIRKQAASKGCRLDGWSG
jgi:hypothetical protein